MSLQELISYLSPLIAETANRHVQHLDEMQSKIDILMINLGTSIPEPLVNSIIYKETDDDIEVTFAYTSPPPFLATMEPLDTLLMGDEVISTNPVRENDEFIKSSVDDLVPIPKELEVTSVCDDLECDMPINTPLPTTYVREENFDINSPLGDQVVDFLMKNVDVADLPRHMVKQPFGLLVKNLSSTNRMSDEPLGDVLKPRSYDEFEDISSLDLPKSAPLNYEPLGNPDSVSRSLETSDLILEKLTAEIGLDDLIPTEIDIGYYDSEGDILFLEHLLIEETFFDLTLAVLPKMSTLLVTPPPTFEQLSLREVERFDLFFFLTQSGEEMREMVTPSLVYIICHHPVLLHIHLRR
nr:hypothetical protein [Tanacetum cinerariifolium]